MMNSSITVGNNDSDSEENHGGSLLSQSSSSTFDASRFFCGGFAGARVHPTFGNNHHHHAVRTGPASLTSHAQSSSSSGGFPDLYSLPFNLGGGLGGIMDTLNKNRRSNQQQQQSQDDSDAMMITTETTESFDSFAAHANSCDIDPASPHSVMAYSERIIKANLAEEQDAVAEALNSLSRCEREHAYQDIHGVADIPFEDEKIVQRGLFEMERTLLEKVAKNEHVATAATSNASIILQAVSTMLQQQRRNYHANNNSCTSSMSSKTTSDTMTSQDFLLLFLRAEDYNVDAACGRLLRFMEEKLELFGAKRLLKDITLDDMNEVDMDVLSCGVIQRIPQKDRAGRDIVIILPGLVPKNVNHRGMVRAFYYVLMSPNMNSLKYDGTASSSSDDKTTTTTTVGDHPQQQQQQKEHRHESHLRGLVQIVHRLPKHTPLDRSLMYKTQKLRHALPYRYSAVHMITDDPTVPMLLGLFKRFMSIKTLSRMQMHCGTDLEVIYKLLSYGIPVMDLPITQDGFCQTEAHLAWVKEQRKIENMVKVKRNKTSFKPMLKIGGVACVENDSMELDSSFGSHEESKRIENERIVNLQQVDNCRSDCLSLSRDTSTMSSSSLSSSPSRRVDAASSISTGHTVVVPTDPEDGDAGIKGGGNLSSSSPATSKSIKEPTSGDILLGRGRVIDTRPGNMKFRRFLAQQLERYDQAPKFQKTEIAEGLLRHLKDTCHVRFLKELPDGKGFLEVDDKTAREKISRTFRRIRETNRGGGGIAVV